MTDQALHGAQLFEALAAAQAEMKNPPLDAVNPHFRARFSSLPAVRDAVVPVLAKHGIAVVQDVTTTTGGVSVRTLLMHKSGETMTFGPLEMPASKLDAQGMGSAMTYAKRYALLAVACVAGDVDDDGAGAVGAEKVSADQAREIERAIQDSGADRMAFLKTIKAVDVAEIPAAEFKNCMALLEAKAKRTKAKQHD